jgi:hypothetical protein
MTGTWQPLANQPTFNTSTMLLLTDGRVMVQEDGTAHWHALRPDGTGSYEKGTWSTLADMSTYRLYYASGILRDGRVIVCGGEYSGLGKDTNSCEIYDPTTDKWAPIASPPGWSIVGDAPCCVLPDGRFMIGSIDSQECAIYDPVADKWSAAAKPAAPCGEETWILLPDNTILTLECSSPYKAERYSIATDSWHDEGTPPVALVDTAMSEIGPAMLLYNGQSILFGAADDGGKGRTAIYTPPVGGANGTWSAGPDIPKVEGKAIVCNDCPATLLPNGKVLFAAAEFKSGAWGSPTLFFEYDPYAPPAQAITQAPSPANAQSVVYTSRLLGLPSGHVLYGNGKSDLRCYVPDGCPREECRPEIVSISPGAGWWTRSFTLTGKRLNGCSQANIYGDDSYAATNYPLVRLRNAFTGFVVYARTDEFSTMGVATGDAIQSLRFTLPSILFGEYELTVVANGIASAFVPFVKVFRKPPLLENRFKYELELLGKEVYEGDPWDRSQWAVDPAVVELQAQVRSLENGLRRLSTLIEAKELPQVGRKLAKTAAAREDGRRENSKTRAKAADGAGPRRKRAGASTKGA